jgi:hypothetical protein
MPADTPEGNPIAMGRPEHDKPGPTISDNEANEVARAIKSTPVVRSQRDGGYGNRVRHLLRRTHGMDVQPLKGWWDA